MSKKAILLTILLLNLPNTVVADIYRWTDKQGTIHISDSPNTLPDNAKKVLESPKRQHPKPYISSIPIMPQRYIPPKYDYPLTKGAIQGVKNLNQTLNNPEKLYQENPYAKELQNETNKFAENLSRNINRKADKQIEKASNTIGLFILIVITIIITWIITIIDILKSEFKGNNKLVWLLTILFIPPIGIIAYMIIGKKHRLIEPNEAGYE